MKTQMVLSWSGGKDAAWTLHVLRQRQDIEVVALLTTVTSGYGRIAMHGIRRDILHAQASAAGLPVVEASIPPQCDSATYEASFATALEEVRRRWPECTHIAFGDLFLDDVRAWREALCARLAWTPLFPLFCSDTLALANAMLEGGLRALLCCVDTRQLGAAFCGRDFDAALLHDLPAGVDPCGEKGEFHTCVHAGPMFDRPLSLLRGERVLRDGRFEYVELELAR